MTGDGGRVGPRRPRSPWLVAQLFLLGAVVNVVFTLGETSAATSSTRSVCPAAMRRLPPAADEGTTTARYGYDGRDVPAPSTGTEWPGKRARPEADGSPARAADAARHDYHDLANLARGVGHPAAPRSAPQTPGFEVPDSRKTTYTYDAAGRAVGMVTPRGNVAGADPDDFRWTYQYFANGNLKKTIDPLAGVTEHTYDQAGRLTSTTDPRGKTTLFAYDANGNQTSVPQGGRTGTRDAPNLATNLGDLGARRPSE